MSDSSRPHGLQHARPYCPSPTPGVYSNSCPLSRWSISYHTLSNHLIQPSHFLLSPPPAFNLSQHQGLFKWVSSLYQVARSIRVSASVLPMNAQDWSLGWIGSPCSPKDSQKSSPHHSTKASVLRRSAFFIVQLSHPYMTTGKIIALIRQYLCWQSNVSAF